MTRPSKAVNLYRSLLRAHKKYLPKDMRSLGDIYIKSEFRLHKSAKPEHLTQFFQEWEKYLDQLLLTARAQQAHLLYSSGSEDRVESVANGSVFQYGRDLPPDLRLSKEQEAQLEKLKEEAAKVAGK